MRFVQLDAPEGPLYVDLHAIDAIGPMIREQVGNRTVEMRALYLRGGQCLAVLETVSNVEALFELKRTAPVS